MSTPFSWILYAVIQTTTGQHVSSLQSFETQDECTEVGIEHSVVFMRSIPQDAWPGIRFVCQDKDAKRYET